LSQLVLSMALLLVTANALRAEPLGDYAMRVSRAITLVEEMRTAYEDESGHVRPEQVYGGNLALVRELLPAKETVNLNGQTVAVNNAWLYNDLSDFEKSTKTSDRHDALARIAERLQSIHERLSELQSAAAQNDDKDAEKGKLAEILRRPEYVRNPPQGNALEQLLERFLRWLSKLIPHPKPIQPGNSRLVSSLAQIVVVAVCVGAIALLIWRYGPRLMRNRRKKKKKGEARIVLGERLEPDQTAADLLAQAEKLAREGNLRAAIRKAYIALLCELGDRKIISLAQHKTNRDYLNAVRNKGSLYTSMRKLTNSFELHWYGFVPVGEADWNEFRTGYRKIVRSD
jgi:Domain of unknown function (DUF4129)